MSRSWSLRRLVTTALLLSYVTVLPLAGILLFRLHQIHTVAPTWAKLAEASRWLTSATVCSGAVSSGMAHSDLVRWRDGLERLRQQPSWSGDNTLHQQLDMLHSQVVATLAAPENAWAPWAMARCQEMTGLAQRSLSGAIKLGLDPASRADRYEDLALRDMVVYLALWLLASAGILAWTLARVDRPARQLEQVLRRIADGDLSTRVPVEHGGAMRDLADALRLVVQRAEQRDRLKVERLGELRNLVRRAVELVVEPVLVIGVDGKLDYANQAAGEAFGEQVTRLEGLSLQQVPGGEAVRALCEEIVTRDESTGETKLAEHDARFSVVRDSTGRASRVILVWGSDPTT